MSDVTDLILITALNDGGGEYEHPNVDRINNWLANTHNGFRLKPAHPKRADGDYGVMQCDVFLGARKLLNLAGLLEVFHSVPWDCPENVQLLVKKEEEDRFSIHLP